ncbi:MAG TPA: hypothetical protein DCM86_19025 [Verrucomicrobiales bacterium]|nr:hypothetical protein [Verrucomicrobiales bacterium]
MKAILGVLLLPLCIGGISALSRVLVASGSAIHFWVAFAAGAACWISIYLLLPKPMWVYVFGHELTHVVWTWVFGGKVKRFRVSSRGGHVLITKSNSLIALAPYFFPIYAVMVVGVYTAGHLIWGWAAYAIWFHLLLGAAYAFHVTLTFKALETEQSDITGQGFFFSAVVIVLGNVAVLLLLLPLVTGVGVLTSMTWWMRDTGAFLHRLALLLR